MPEKPEVITVAKSLEPRIIHKEITGCNVYWNRILAEPSVEEFSKKIVHEKIEKVSTRGKFIVIELTHYILLIHLRMEGKFFFRKKGDPIQKHEHVEFLLDQDLSFRYHDFRKFGKMYLMRKEDAFSKKPLSELGVEYDDSSFNEEYLLKKFARKNLPIKTVLLDQSIVAGIGNIYDDEILFMSRIHPLQEASSLNKENCIQIVKNTRKVLDHAVQLGGTTIRSFTSSEGVHGLFQNELLIHGKSICPNCGGSVKKIQVHGRGTYYCEKCQMKI